MAGRVQGTLVMKTPFSCLLAIATVLVVSAPAAHPAHAQPQQNPAPAPVPAPPSTPAAAPAPAKHTVTVRFDYDFDRTPPCSAAANPAGKACVRQFVVYDISSGVAPSRRAQLFVVPVPPNAKGAMREITGTSPPLPFERGKHRIGVSAQMSDNKTESFPSKCAVWVKIP